MELNALHQLDFYKTGHHLQYPEGIEYVYSNLTARSGSHSNIEDSNGVVFVGLQLFIKDYLINSWNKSFFWKNREFVVERYKRRVQNALGTYIDVSHIEALHRCGYLPIHIKSLPEGSFVPYKVPLLTIINTLPEFYWLPNFLESVMSADLWQMINSATTYREYMRVFTKYAEKTDISDSLVPFQAHDFSFRGMAGREASARSGFAALACGSKGTDSVSAIDIAEDYYYASDSSLEFIAGSVPATEHSVMSSSIEALMLDEGMSRKDAELRVFHRLITKVYPTGPISIVSDTFDFWRVVGEILPELKEVILSRKGTVIIRPDSGDPVDIICGKDSGTELEQKGLIECLWDIFGGAVNAKGYKVLNKNIGAIYGDSITLARQKQILSKLEAKGFASSNIILGVGSYTYQMTTRDTHGIAMKATSCTVKGRQIDIYKDPKTDSGVKKSAKGLLMVYRIGNTFELRDQVTKSEEGTGALRTVFKDGTEHNTMTLEDVRYNVKCSLR